MEKQPKPLLPAFTYMNFLVSGEKKFPIACYRPIDTPLLIGILPKNDPNFYHEVWRYLLEKNYLTLLDVIQNYKKDDFFQVGKIKPLVEYALSVLNM